jgi:hypothetical protein
MYTTYTHEQIEGPQWRLHRIPDLYAVCITYPFSYSFIAKVKFTSRPIYANAHSFLE